MAFQEFYTTNGGSNLNSGSTSGAPIASDTTSGGNWNGGSVYASATLNTSAVVNAGQWVSIYTAPTSQGNTGFIARINSFTSSTLTVSTSALCGTVPVSSLVANAIVGGAWLGPSGNNGFPFNFMTTSGQTSAGLPPRINFQNNQTYSITSGMVQSQNGPIKFQGFTNTPGDGGRATFDGSGRAIPFTMLTANTNRTEFEDFIFQNNGTSGSADMLAVAWAKHVLCQNSRGNGFNVATAIECEAYNCNISNTANQGGFLVGIGGSVLIRCYSHDNLGSNTNGFYASLPAIMRQCIADTNGLYGLRVGNNNSSVVNCDFYNNISDGINCAINSTIYVENSNFVNNLGYGLSANNNVNGWLVNCGFYGNTSGQVNSLTIDNLNPITYTANPYVLPASGNFNLYLPQSRNKGQGAFPETTNAKTGTSGYPDVGAARLKQQAPRQSNLSSLG